mmetsp:Transcript_3239/g.6670  ORF Transcript_3239/g.6670 Transcript_3239/m.6670 type:complete len:329 (+) Transcript_3239:184-1170(+)
MEKSIRGRLSLSVIQARLTRDTELFGKMDPYCVIRLGRVKTKTKTHKNGGKFPMWNAEFSINVETDDNLILEVWDKDFFKHDDLVGSAELDLRIVLRETNTVNDWFDLLYKGKKAGTLRLQLKYDLVTTYFGGMVSQAAQMTTKSTLEDFVGSAVGSLNSSISSIRQPVQYAPPQPPPPSYIPQQSQIPYAPTPEYRNPSTPSPYPASPSVGSYDYQRSQTYTAPYQPSSATYQVPPPPPSYPSYPTYHPAAHHLVYQQLPPTTYAPQGPQYPQAAPRYPMENPPSTTYTPPSSYARLATSPSAPILPYHTQSSYSERRDTVGSAPPE